MNTPTLKLVLIGTVFCITVFGLNAQNVGINTTGTTPSKNAILDLNTGNSNNLGIIIPNVTLGASLNTFSPPIANAATGNDIGMMVYNSSAANQPVGYYYWDGGTWNSLSGGGSPASANNGLSLAGGNIQLGGVNPLLANTTISSGGFNLDFGGGGIFQLGTPASKNGTLQFLNSTNGSAVNITSGVTTAPYTMILPVAQGAANTVLINNGAGVLSWGNATAAANNGLSMNGTNVQLGGTNPLLANTTISTGGFNLDLGGGGAFQLGTPSSANGTLQFFNSTNGTVISLSSGITSASYNLTLPTAQGLANTVLLNNGAGVLSWTAVAAGANNGLTLNGTNAQLGGANPLLANTIINSGGFNLDFGGTGAFQLGSPATATGTLQFLNSTNGSAVSISSGVTTAPYTMILPVAQGAANTILTNNGAGVLSWSAPAITGTGTNNYLVRWTPNSTSLGIGVVQDNGTSVGINSAPVGNQMLNVTQTTAANIAIMGQNTAAAGTSNGVGVYGLTSQAYSGGNNGYGVVAINGNASGTGLYVAGNNLGFNYNYLLAGSGVAMNGTNYGGFAYATASSGGGLYGQGGGGNSTGIVGGGNNYAPATLVSGSGGAFTGSSIGVFAENATSLNSAPFYGYNNTIGKGAYLAYYNGTFYKTIATGAATNSCSVPDLNGNFVCMHASETPEAYFEDYGQGQLTNGKTHIDIDPIFAKNVTINEKHPLRVYIQLEGDCKGVYVTNKTNTGFDVVELSGGTSNITFQYHIICNMADAKMPSGLTSKFADLRFEPAPKDLPQDNASELTKTKIAVEQVKPAVQNQH